MSAASPAPAAADMATVLNQRRQAEILHSNGGEGGAGGLANGNLSSSPGKMIAKGAAGYSSPGYIAAAANGGGVLPAGLQKRDPATLKGKEWNVRPRIAALESRNPIRDIVETKLMVSAPDMAFVILYK